MQQREKKNIVMTMKLKYEQRSRASFSTFFIFLSLLELTFLKSIGVKQITKKKSKKSDIISDLEFDLHHLRKMNNIKTTSSLSDENEFKS